jgi:hypothetical protein
MAPRRPARTAGAAGRSGTAGHAGEVTPPPPAAPLPVKKPVSTVQRASDALPIPHYGELSVASLRARLRVLDEPAIMAMLAYEKGHAHRDAVITMFERRLAKLRGQAG